MFRFAREKIMPLFENLGITLKEFALRAGVPEQSLYRALNGGRMRAPTACKIAAVLGVDVLSLLED